MVILASNKWYEETNTQGNGTDNNGVCNFREGARTNSLGRR
jgi:hypothetical protein